MLNQFLVQKRLVMSISGHKSPCDQNILILTNISYNHKVEPNGPCVKVPSDPSPWSNRALRGCLKNQAALWCYYRFKELRLLHCHYSAGNEMVRTVHGAKQECNPRIHSRQSEERQQSSTILTFSLGAWASWAFIVHNWIQCCAHHC